MNDHAKRTGPAVEAYYQFLMWLIPTVDRFPKSQKFVFGDRILKLALDVLEFLVEATFTPHLARANLAIDKLRFATEQHMGFAMPMLIGTWLGSACVIIAVLISPETKGKVFVPELMKA